MKYKIAYSNSFLKDYKKIKARGKNLEKLKEIIDTLGQGIPLAPKHKEHILSGKYKDMRECHIEPDWLLVWLDEKDRPLLTFVRTGTHSDLFG